MIRQHIACLSSLLFGLSVKGLIVEEVGDFDQHSHPMGPFEITRYPHYDKIKESIKQQDGSIDYTLYVNQLPDEAEGSEHLTDLPDELQELQQQLLEASRVEVHSHDIEVDNSTGWPWYMATIPPGDFYDCLFLYFSCTDYETPDWPENKEKCTNLFDYCITYTEKNANSTDPKDPFVTKIPISSEIISSSSKPSVSFSSTTTKKPIQDSSTIQQTETSTSTSANSSTSSSNDVSESTENSSSSQASSTEASVSSTEDASIPTQSTTSSDKSPVSTQASSTQASSTESSSVSSTEETSTSSESSSSSENPTLTTEGIASSSGTPSTTSNSLSSTLSETSSEQPPTSSIEPSSSSEASTFSKPQPTTSEKTEVSSGQTTPEQSISSSEAPASKPEQEKPSSETSSSETPSSETSSSETPSSETPSSETPSSETPSSETPSTSNTSSEDGQTSTDQQTSSEEVTSTASSTQAAPSISSTEQISTESSSVSTSSTSSVPTESATLSTAAPTTPTTASTTTSATITSESNPNEESATLSTTSSTTPSTTPSIPATTLSTTPSTTPSPTPSTTPSTTTSTTPSTTTSSNTPSTSSSAPTTEKPTTVEAEQQNAIISGLPLPPGPPAAPPKKPASCSDLYELKGIRESGTYPILVSGKNITVYCDMETEGGGWTVLQRRGDYGTAEDYFLRKWEDYKDGFGKPEEDHWVGLTYWNNITLSKPQQLLIEMEDWVGNKTQIAVNNFIIGTEFYKFRIIYASVDGEFGASLPKKGTKFSTIDKDNDAWRNNCASRFKGAWWYSACHNSNLNGLYLKGEHESFGNGVNWYHWTGYHYSLKRAEMKVRVQSKALSLGFLEAGTSKSRK